MGPKKRRTCPIYARSDSAAPPRSSARQRTRTKEADTTAGTPRHTPTMFGEVAKKPICRNVMQSLSWVGYILTRACLCSLDVAVAHIDVPNSGADFTIPEYGSWLETFAVFWTSMSISTAFSGIDAPGHAVHLVDQFLVCALGDRLTSIIGGDVLSLRAANMVWAVEKDNLARNELLCSPLRPQHVYGCIEDFLSDAYKEPGKLIRTLSTWSFEDLRDGLKSGEFITLAAHCSENCCGKVKRGCKNLLKTLVKTFAHLAGPPCIDHSPQGARKEAWGEAFLPMFIWMCILAQLDFQCVLFENVPEYSLKLVMFFLDWKFAFESIVTGPNDDGFPVLRDRRITWLLLRSALKAVVTPFSEFSRLCSRTTGYSWEGLLVATDVMLAEDLAWAERRPTSCIRDKNFQKLSQSQQAIALESKWTKALTRVEIEFLEQYRLLFYSSCADGRMCAVIGQDPAKHPQWIAGQLMLTVISNSPVLWVKGFDPTSGQVLERFVHPVEMLLSQGFPAMELYTPYDFKASWLFPNATRSRPSTVRQAGNSMNLAVIGKSLAWVATQVEWHQVEPLDDFLAKFC